MGKRGPKPKPKPREIKPTMMPQVFEMVNDISYLTDVPLHTIGEDLWRAGMGNVDLFHSIKLNFIYPYEFDNGEVRIVFLGDREHQRLVRSFPNDSPRLTMYFDAIDTSKLDYLAHALRTYPGTAAGFIVERAVQTDVIVVDLIEKYVRDKDLDFDRRQLLRKVLKRVDVKAVGETRFALRSLMRIITDPLDVVAAAMGIETKPEKTTPVRRDNPYAARNRRPEEQSKKRPLVALPSMFKNK